MFAYFCCCCFGLALNIHTIDRRKSSNKNIIKYLDLYRMMMLRQMMNELVGVRKKSFTRECCIMSHVYIFYPFLSHVFREVLRKYFCSTSESPTREFCLENELHWLLPHPEYHHYNVPSISSSTIDDASTKERYIQKQQCFLVYFAQSTVHQVLKISILSENFLLSDILSVCALNSLPHPQLVCVKNSKNLWRDRKTK